MLIINDRNTKIIIIWSLNLEKTPTEKSCTDEKGAYKRKGNWQRYHHIKNSTCMLVQEEVGKENLILQWTD